MSTLRRPWAIDGDNEEDLAEIRELLAAATTAWAAGNAVAYAALFARDSDLVGPDGILRRGRLANERWHSRLFSGSFRGTEWLSDVESIRFLAADVAVAHELSALVLPWRHRARPRAVSRGTWVLIKQDGRWWVSAVQHTRLRTTETSGGRSVTSTVVNLRNRLARRTRPGRAA
ncbi:SgcJ/EcaC family oxidoreductase [Actinoalloteichus hymeniacidonis]|uniref:DUF4440 domain-containing protein n=1 Tax=Actinoalloteichus hymeniacidonis TaxID=340345 RepID=A0AAC9MZJ0_9PSEU|nr:SgcJ/EcaC family oxidoreductase [Actinoalloteichus hymeniacidonis]AOS64425.1 hypothetical protein TL08_18140 [Actinoalloteichus hymeniacidonis]MBB5907507.1 uncharacterized protein (TIGR02246 family) [Actinoalloteichus hymeniacidonis]